MKNFDWDFAKNSYGHLDTTVDWLKSVHDKPLTEEEFINQYKSLPKRKGSDRSPHKLKQRYKHLKEVFGFFR